MPLARFSWALMSFQCRWLSVVSLARASPKTWGWRRISFSLPRRATSCRVSGSLSLRISQQNAVMNSRSASSSRTPARSPSRAESTSSPASSSR